MLAANKQEGKQETCGHRRSLFSLRFLIIFLVNRGRKGVGLSIRHLQCGNTQCLKMAFHLKLLQR